jgi:hypothetical protein
MTLSISNMLWRTAFALAAAAFALLWASTDARAAGPRPLFQMPVPCGQTWDAATYSNHWTVWKDGELVSHPDAIDLAQRGEDLENLSAYEPALASAAGTISSLAPINGDEFRVSIDHGGGWTTDYVHLVETPAKLAVGQHVDQGEVIGRIGKSGASSYHLHYNQRKDGYPTRIAFNGVLIDTHAGNLDSYGTYGTDDAEKLTSLNCAGNSFVPFVQNGMRYQLIYKPATGYTKIVRLDADAEGVTTTWSGYLETRFTSLVPFTLSGGQQHMLAYQASTGLVQFHRFNGQGDGTTLLEELTWGKSWTHITPFTLGGKPYLIVYDSLNGYANVERVNAEGSGTKNIYKSTWDRGWTSFAPFELGGVQYVHLYKGGTGYVEIDRLTGSGDNVAFTQTWSDDWSSGWTTFVTLKHNGGRYLFGYKAETGQVTYNKLESNGLGVDHLGDATWTTGWTSITPFLHDGDGALFIYKGGDGAAQTRLLNAAGSGSSSLWTDDWTSYWT